MKYRIPNTLWLGIVVLAIGMWLFLGWIIGYDIQYNRLGAAETLTIVGYYFTCETWQEFYVGTSPPCLAGHTAGWDLIPVGLLFGGMVLIVYAFIKTKGHFVKAGQQSFHQNR